MPGIENFAPDRTLTSNGSAGSPSVRPIAFLDEGEVAGDLRVEPVRGACRAAGNAGRPPS